MWSSCETDFSLNGDYEITPIVFGLLDHEETTHIVKITKAYLGDGDNLVYAQTPDSNYFATVDAKVTEYLNGNPTGREWQLHDSIITNKDTTGVFYGPEQKVYVFYESTLNEEAEYVLTADLNEGQHQIEASTEMINGFYLPNSVYSNKQLAFAKDNVAGPEDYTIWTFVVQEGEHALRYNYKYTIYWTEYYSNGTNQSFNATRNQGDKDQINPDAPAAHSIAFNGIDFYEWVGQIIPDDANVIKRTFDGLTLRVTVAHEDLDQYLDVAKPVSSIAQVQPEFTNVQGGLGLFSSRVRLEVGGFFLNKSSRKHLCLGPYTVSKLFCSDNPADVSENWYCD